MTSSDQFTEIKSPMSLFVHELFCAVVSAYFLIIVKNKTRQ